MPLTGQNYRNILIFFCCGVWRLILPVRFFYLYVRESGAVLFLYHRHEYGCIGGADRGCKSVGEGSRQLFVEACYAGRVHFYAGSCIYRLGTADERKLYLLASGRTGCERGCLGRHQYCDFSDAVCLCTVRTPCQLCQLLLNNGWVCRIFFIHARLDICGISKGYQDFKHSGR